MHRAARVTSLASLSLALAACGSGQKLDANGALPAGTTYLTGNLEPMVVDWQPEQRGDLETSLRDGVAVVTYDAKGLRLLRDCHVDGTYDYLGMTRRERVVRLRSLDDVRANLPLGGLGLAAQVGGEFQKGATLDIAMVMVGKLRTTWKSVAPKDLVGSCQGATHFVRGATVGAFAVDRGDSTRARSAAEIFGLGASGGHAASSSVRVVDGQIEGCAAAAPDSARAPAQCGALLRIELGAITSAAAPASAAPETASTCAPPLVRLDGVCTRADTSLATRAECTFGDAAGCRASCRAGNATSCWKIARMLYLGDGVAKSPAESFAIARDACAADEPKACTLLGILHSQGVGTAKDKRAALAKYQQACELGDADGCGNGGDLLAFGIGMPVDLRRGTALLGYGCNGGNQSSCNTLGFLALGTSGAAQDLPTAQRFFKRACDGGNAFACSNLAGMLEFGLGVRADVRAAGVANEKACELDGSLCSAVAINLELARPVRMTVPRDELYRRACAKGSNFACTYVSLYVDPSVPPGHTELEEDLKGKRELCAIGMPRPCGMAGVLLIGAGRRDEGRALLERGCKLGDEWACVAGRYRTVR